MADKVNRGGTGYATTRPNSVHKSKKSNIMANNLKNGKDIHSDFKNCGRIGYAQKAIELGVYTRICQDIQMYREQNEKATYKEVYTMLHEKYPQVFYLGVDKIWESNISKLINSDTNFSRAFFCNQSRLFSQAKIKMMELLESNECSEKSIIEAYKVLSKQYIEEKRLEAESQANTSDGDIPTFTLRIESDLDNKGEN